MKNLKWDKGVTNNDMLKGNSCHPLDGTLAIHQLYPLFNCTSKNVTYIARLQYTSIVTYVTVLSKNVTYILSLTEFNQFEIHDHVVVNV